MTTRIHRIAPGGRPAYTDHLPELGLFLQVTEPVGTGFGTYLAAISTDVDGHEVLAVEIFDRHRWAGHGMGGMGLLDGLKRVAVRQRDARVLERLESLNREARELLAMIDARDADPKANPFSPEGSLHAVLARVRADIARIEDLVGMGARR